MIKKVDSSFPLNDNLVDSCWRLGKQELDGSPPGIIVKFAQHMDMKEFMRKKRAKLEMTARSLGFNGESNIYVNESLIPARRRLLKLAKEAKKLKDYQFVWVRVGKFS